MTKADEIKLLDKMIDQFGPNSYLGPWLKDNRTSIVADINNDISISAPMPNAATLKGWEIIGAAKLQAEALRKQASEQAAKEIEAARETCAGVRRHAKWLLEEAAKKL